MKYWFGHKVFQLEIQMVYNKQTIGKYKAVVLSKMITRTNAIKVGMYRSTVRLGEVVFMCIIEWEHRHSGICRHSKCQWYFTHILGKNPEREMFRRKVCGFCPLCSCG